MAAPRNLPEAPSARRLFAFVKQRQQDGLPWPTADEIGRHMGWRNGRSARDAFVRLVRRGVLAYESEKRIGRNWYYTYRLTGKDLE